MTPSAAQIEKYFPSKGKEIRKLLDGRKNPEEYESVQYWIRQCYHRPKEHELILCAVDEVLNTCGVETIRKGTRPLLDYCNTGESYNATIGYRYDSDNFCITSWGDFVENYQRRHGKID